MQLSREQPTNIALPPHSPLVSELRYSSHSILTKRNGRRYMVCIPAALLFARMLWPYGTADSRTKGYIPHTAFGPADENVPTSPEEYLQWGIAQQLEQTDRSLGDGRFWTDADFQQARTWLRESAEKYRVSTHLH